MGKLILYGFLGSAPVRATLLTLRALDLPFEFQVVNLFTGDHLSKEYIAKNPQHTIPTLEDDGKYIWDSHAIITYLANKYGQDNTLYPRDPYQRAVVDQRLHYDSGTVFNAMRNITASVFHHNITEVPQEKIDAIIAVYDMLETLLKDNAYIAGNHLTIADLSLISTVTSLNVLWPVDAEKFGKLAAWIKSLQALPYYDESNAKGLQVFTDAIASKNLKYPN